MNLHVQVSLKNYGKTCWLNSILKFIASTTFYDQMLTDAPEADRKKLQGLLREIIVSMRTGKAIEDNFFKAFLHELKQANLKDITFGIQNDAPEFLHQLTHVLKWKPAYAKGAEIEQINKQEIYPRLGVSYKPNAPMPVGWSKHVSIDNYQTALLVTVPESNDKELDLSSLIQEECIREVKPDKIMANPPQANVGEMSFKTTSQFINLPNVIMVYVKRYYTKDRANIRINAPIKLEQNKFISFRRHDVVYQNIGGNSYATSLVPKEMCHYRIGAAVVQRGGFEGGHYVCLEQSQDGSKYEHSDESIIAFNKADFGAEGYFLRLDRVENN